MRALAQYYVSTAPAHSAPLPFLFLLGHFQVGPAWQLHPYASSFIFSHNRCSKRCGFHVRDYRNLAILSPYLSSVSSANRWRITWRRFNRTHQKSRGSLRSGRFLCYQQSPVQRNPRFDLRTPSEILAELPIKPSCAPFLLTTWGRTVSAVNAERSRRRRRRCSRCSLLAGTPL